MIMPVVKGRKMIVNQPKVEGFDFFKTLADQDGNWSDLFGKKTLFRCSIS